MKKRERKIILTAAVMAVMFGISPRVNAMHIMEGYLPATLTTAGPNKTAPSPVPVM